MIWNILIAITLSGGISQSDTPGRIGIKNPASGLGFISKVYKGSPADLAGLKVGDRILFIKEGHIDGPAGTPVHLLVRSKDGTAINIEVERVPWDSIKN